MNHESQCLPPTLEARLNQPRLTSQQALAQADRFLSTRPKRSQFEPIAIKPSTSASSNGRSKTAS